MKKIILFLSVLFITINTFSQEVLFSIGSNHSETVAVFIGAYDKEFNIIAGMEGFSGYTTTETKNTGFHFVLGTKVENLYVATKFGVTSVVNENYSNFYDDVHKDKFDFGFKIFS